jgi:hypothetical protein
MADDLDGLAHRGLALDALDRAGKYPGMAVAQRFLAAELEDDGWGQSR